MEHGNMRWLVWKEYRQNRLIVFAMLFLLVAPYAIGFSAFFTWRVYSPSQELLFRGCLSAAGAYSLALSQLIMALIGGNAIAGERAERSAEFQAYLPIPRGKILAAKLLLVLVMVAVIWVPNALVLGGASDTIVSEVGDEGIGKMLGCVAIVGLTMFSAAWLLSSTLSSPTFPVLAGLFAPVLVVWGILAIAELRKLPETPLIAFWFPTICLPLAPICFVIGTWLYLRRVEP